MWKLLYKIDIQDIHYKYGKLWPGFGAIAFSFSDRPFVGMKTILLVDDDQQVRELFGLVLRRSGYGVIEADSGVAGLELARQHLPI